ncbi:hypothetical protein SA0515718_02511 [Staphylococcus aureus]|nr:hypothetical protein USA300HOU_0600 [Staphylococcus aureus subsp. aureus USA300_TCH1516]AEZ36686.1 hypothetical protein SAVC_02610 [Staphylococcus aureus subsp. aureus VC40]AMV76645.1 hypothetical protein SAST40_00577 [Staphylococcus aureus]EPZ03647.1 hypothetical protein M400_13125 [Staphylococcus aureus S100]EPZ04085.1 hypothetical protein M398_13260 [Staphylococcus aureus S130]EPZ04979.1 hypothetical protein M399_12710 [Staphylococcus aureus S123]EPZ11228.1 hypothetical protein M401_127
MIEIGSIAYLNGGSKKYNHILNQENR